MGASKGDGLPGGGMFAGNMPGGNMAGPAIGIAPNMPGGNMAGPAIGIAPPAYSSSSPSSCPRTSLNMFPSSSSAHPGGMPGAIIAPCGGITFGTP